VLEVIDWMPVLRAYARTTASGSSAGCGPCAADWIAHRFGLDHALVRLLAITFCREVHIYLTVADRRGAVRDTVADTITAEEPRVLLAHSSALWWPTRPSGPASTCRSNCW
jgi:hypothetical protein